MSEPNIDDFQLRGRLRVSLGHEPQWWEMTQAARATALNSRLGAEIKGIVRKAKIEDWFYLFTIRAAGAAYMLIADVPVALIFALVWHKHGYWHDAGVWWCAIVILSAIVAFFRGFQITVAWNGRKS